MKKIYSYIIVVFIFIIGFIVFQNNRTTTNNSSISENKIIIENTIHVRYGPGLSYPSVSHVKEGQVLTKLEEQGEWIKVSVGETDGWIPSWQTVTNEQQQTTSRKIAISQVEGLNVRAEPTTSSSVLKQLNIGTELMVEKEEENWIKIVDTSGISGWVSKDYITLSETTVEEPLDHVKPNQITVQVEMVNVRKEPNPSSTIIGTVNQNNSFEILEEKDHWLKIELPDHEIGWIYRFYGIVNSSESTNSEKNYITIVNDGTNLRESPSTTSPVVKRAKLGETFEIVSKDGEWYKVTLNTKETAYVAEWVVSTNINQQDNIEKDVKIERKKGTLNGVTIVLDPGHGGNDQGTSGFRGSIEKDITLLTTQLLQSKLQEAGATVYLTRESDMYVDLKKRVSIAHHYAADAFISIHYDATEDSEISGFTTYYYHDYQQNLAEAVNHGIEKKVSLRDRGAQFGDYLVLRENYQNAILIELGYLSNPQEERVITSSLYREHATHGIFEGIINYFDAQLP